MVENKINTVKNEKIKIIIAWILLIVSIIISFILSYLKFFAFEDNKIEERPINGSSSNAIHTALNDIVVNFNQNSNLKKYADENSVIITASVNNYSIFISYITDITTTYEFMYDNLCLNIIVNNNNVEDKEKFNIIYGFLIEAVQNRLNNTNDFSEVITNFLNSDLSYDGLTKIKLDNGTRYKMDITKKINFRVEE